MRISSGIFEVYRYTSYLLYTILKPTKIEIQTAIGNTWKVKIYTTKRHTNHKSEKSNSTTTNKHTYISSTTFQLQCFLSQGSSNRRGLWGNTGKLVFEDIFFMWEYDMTHDCILFSGSEGKNSERTWKDTWKHHLKVIFFHDLCFLTICLAKCWHVTWKRKKDIDRVSWFDPHLVIFGMELFRWLSFTLRIEMVKVSPNSMWDAYGSS